MNSSVNAAFSFGTMPASTIACATCGRAIVSPPAISRTRSNSIGYPSSWSFSIISSPRRNRVSVSRRSSSRSASFDGSIQYARTCRLASSYSAENSIPGTSSILSPGRRGRLVESRQRVVVGDRDPCQPALHGQVDQLSSA